MASINQNRYPNALPDFRNLGVMLRILVIVTAMTAVAAALKAYTLDGWFQWWIAISALVQPVTILSLLVLGIASPWLRRIDYRAGIVFVVVLQITITALVTRYSWGLFDAGGTLARHGFFSAAATLTLIGYFHLRNRALSPALTEARLQALQARIRPHFLFNSINAVLSLVRSEPRRAETALEDLADLFRVLMADNRELVPLERELELCRQYLGIEQLRLGARLQVDWRLERMPADALVPPLILQPLLENAVYHGIEPSSEAGTVTMEISSTRDQVRIALRNPFRSASRHQSGNKMALANIRERLQLHFDAEASLSTRASDGVFEAQIVLPYVRDRE
jgi:two-component system, LytTR family, sensor histidine kinase AlgZ